MSGLFSIGIYGQSGLVMDWFGLNDPFTQHLPIKITNNWSGTIWVQGELNSPPTGVYTAYSGISMGTSIATGTSAVREMTWNVNVSGQTDTSSPVTHALTLGLLAFTSSNYTGALASGSFAFSNTLFSRWSGVIKVFGDIYSNDQPTPLLAQKANGALSGSYFYYISYFLSGWESDIGSGVAVTLNSGFNSVLVTWNQVVGVTQYALWRSSGTSVVTSPGSILSGTVDLVAITSGTSFQDSGVTLASGFYRCFTWISTIPDSSDFFSPPASRLFNQSGVVNASSHFYQTAKNISGVGLLGPVWISMVVRPQSNIYAWALQTAVGADGNTVGTVIADSTVPTQQSASHWFRNAFVLGGSGTSSSSGWVFIQFVSGPNVNFDDVFVVAQS